MGDAPDVKDPWKVFDLCPGCGAKGVEVRADRSVRCRRCGLHLYLNVAAAVAGLIEDDIGRLLMTIRAKDPGDGMLDLPGGFVDPAESAEDALVREVKEELNLDVARCSIRYLGSFPNTYPYNGIRYATLDAAFVCSVDSYAPQRLSDEIRDVRLYNPDDIRLELIAFGSIRRIVEAYVKRRKR